MNARPLNRAIQSLLAGFLLITPAAIWPCTDPGEHWQSYLRTGLLFRPAYLATDCPLPADMELPLTERFAIASRAEQRALVQKRTFLLPEAIPTLLSLYYEEKDLRTRLVQNLSQLATVAHREDLYAVFRQHLIARDPALEAALLGVARIDARQSQVQLRRLTEEPLSLAERAALLYALTVFRDPAGLSLAEEGLSGSDPELKRKSRAYLLHLASRESVTILQRAYYAGLLKEPAKSRAAMLVRTQSLHERADGGSRITSALKEGSILDILNLSDPGFCQKSDCRWAQVMDYHGESGWAPLESLVFLPGTGE
ncbi:MAG: hypothetical protein HS115_03295 [Spirochaetales bacterium]|nr:hypothetical protein [Spirochaetales bacterium]